MADLAESLGQGDTEVAIADNGGPTSTAGPQTATGSAASEPQPPRPNRRAHPRYVARWRAALIGDRVRHLGRTENVSISGAAVLCDANLRPGQELNLYLEIPQKNSNQPAVFEALAVVMHSTLTPQGFRLGLSFRFYRGDSQSILRKALSSGNYRELLDPHYS